MKKILFSIVAVLMLSISVNAQQISVGSKAPALSNIEWIGGKQPVDLKKPMFIDFFATWCGPCRKVMPHLEELAKEYSGKVNFVVLSNEDVTKMQSFFGDVSSKPFFVGVDTKGVMFTAYGIKTIPHGVLIDKSGKVVWMGNSAALTNVILDGVVKK